MGFRRFASPDGRKLWASAEFDGANLEIGLEDQPRGINPTSSHPEICRQMAQMYRERRAATGEEVGGWLLTSDDAGGRWRLEAALPTPAKEANLDSVPQGRDVHLRLADGALRIGNPRRGWNIYDPTTRRFTQAWGERGVAYGLQAVLSPGQPNQERSENFEVSPQVPKPKGYSIDSLRPLPDGTVFSSWTNSKRQTLFLRGRDGREVSRVRSTPRFTLTVRPANVSYGCPVPKRVVATGLDQIALAADGNTVWGLTLIEKRFRCGPGNSPTSTSIDSWCGHETADGPGKPCALRT